MPGTALLTRFFLVGAATGRLTSCRFTDAVLRFLIITTTSQ
jgi:hypothetical protein